MKTVAIIDYGMGNLHSVSKAVEHVAPDTRVLVTDNAELIRSADRVILPGVGAIRDCMAEIRRLGIDELVREVSADRPLLGICVGMQALMSRSEENGWVDCIDLFQSEVRFFGDNLTENGERLKVPHMGWNEVRQTMDHPLWHDIPDGDRFYFVHSYYAEAEGNPDIAGCTHYGVDLAAAVARDNIFAVQFHPEKSARAGLQLLKNFTNWTGTC
ncbi:MULTISPECIES: imidazole glycerol phosphate synthase subunit HisH [Marinobacter]|jgi:imidazole glycerol-phosphate synthase subunit HisH|uniref:Imidazole glycerol phosphate synthase subunit HisH n=1 Tax=Marinobacter salarius TaxID=1420917 RepID=A0ABY1FPT4_9GAMM|nr:MULTISPECIES: imidazole glycerol phosphate synthase subunit HisH [Marinobacter]KXJ44928.1 MAG: imidazole glycerol phosphate synthase subunit HisH [Marinobacter sp. Hex_13]MAB53978.1 imidazole glycerol phosphate synthase subunit HisH [Marinobacter sp.]OLF85757.1 imidazole glycerol phosphate synthase subunit HisH [Marinobacter sp. C18]SFL81286.1 glutamine amidotransferase [Marinobacter salarius]|tara:strand:- start:976 stop:1617 length:642 start_codon:yes stop_codon:yes gene_type:complete|eukprot:TRINITY_DN5844_c0_g1_i1.p1 TRINITY_DN5844_c0_g1~~TRINITY_DN5844_c0_g1_i1.p1  ORF type:complete len:225 (+),score=27.86 TRINITY_DN5844_c0_g1_i1:35-676(+)